MRDFLRMLIFVFHDFDLSLIEKDCTQALQKALAETALINILNSLCIYIYIILLTVIRYIVNNSVIFILLSLINFTEELCGACLWGF